MSFIKEKMQISKNIIYSPVSRSNFSFFFNFNFPHVSISAIIFLTSRAARKEVTFILVLRSGI